MGSHGKDDQGLPGADPLDESATVLSLQLLIGGAITAARARR